jgi:phosphoadenosine phosphosulfate reductase
MLPSDWSKLNQQLNAHEVLEYSIEHLLNQGDIIFLTAFGPEGCVILKMLADLKITAIHSTKELDQNNKGKFAIANLDTGYQFNETLELKSKLEAKYKLPILMIEPSLSVLAQNDKYGKDLFARDPDQCCYIRKLVPLNKLLSNRLAWITSIRREQSPHRADAESFEYDKKFCLGKINPLVHWTKSDVWQYIHEYQIPYNPLLDRGYDSIGCEPCTQPGEGRKGRWAGQDKIECGLHLQDQEMKQGGEFTI